MEELWAQVRTTIKMDSLLSKDWCGRGKKCKGKYEFEVLHGVPRCWFSYLTPGNSPGFNDSAQLSGVWVVQIRALFLNRSCSFFVNPECSRRCCVFGELQSSAGACIVETKMKQNFSRFSFTFRYWRTVAASAE